MSGSLTNGAAAGPSGFLVCITDLTWVTAPHCPLLPWISHHSEGSSHRDGAADAKDVKEEEEEMKQYREFQNRQVQSLLELREAQVNTEAERKLEHLKQVRCMWWPGSLLSFCFCLGDWLLCRPVIGPVTSWLPMSPGSTAVQGGRLGCTYNSVQKAEGDE